MNVLEGESARLALRMRSGDRIPDAWLTLAASRRAAGMAVQGAASLSDVVLVDAAGGRRTIPFAEALSITATIHDRDATVHVTIVSDGLTRGGRIAEATVVSGAFSAWLFDESQTASHFVDDDAEEDDGDEAVGGWAAAAAASASAKKREVVEDAELTWAQVAAVSESARTPPPRPTKLRSRPRVEPTVPLPRVESIPTSRDRAVEPEYLDEPMPERGDHVSHKQFGLCKVERIDDDGGLRVKLPGGQRKQIKLDPFVVQGPRTDGAGRRVFDLVPRRK